MHIGFAGRNAASILTLMPSDPGQIDIKPRSRDVTDGLEKTAARGMLRAGPETLPRSDGRVRAQNELSV